MRRPHLQAQYAITFLLGEDPVERRDTRSRLILTAVTAATAALQDEEEAEEVPGRLKAAEATECQSRLHRPQSPQPVLGSPESRDHL